MGNIVYSGSSDVGYHRESNEDFVHMKEIDNKNNIYFGVVADGAGSKSARFQPATLASVHIERTLERIYKSDPKFFTDHTEIILRECLSSASAILNTFHAADEEHYAGFAASLTCVVIINTRLTFAHSGNTRLHLIRKNKKTETIDVKQLTEDQTEGMKLVKSGELTFEAYHLHPGRLVITGGLGMTEVPRVQTFTLTLRDNDFILITSDGIHDAIRPDNFGELLIRSETCDETVNSLITAAKGEKYEDNMTALLIWNAVQEE